MPSYCCVPQCNGLGGFIFPKDNELRKKWLIAIKREDYNKCLWRPSEHSVVCHRHFKATDFVEPKVKYGNKRRKVLHQNAVPSKFSFRPELADESEHNLRYKRRFYQTTSRSQAPGSKI